MECWHTSVLAAGYARLGKTVTRLKNLYHLLHELANFNSLSRLGFGNRTCGDIRSNVKLIMHRFAMAEGFFV